MSIRRGLKETANFLACHGVSLIFIAVLCLTAAVYWHTLPFGYQYDDIPAIVENPGLRVPGWALADLSGVLKQTPPGLNNRPVSQLVFLLNYRAAGLDPKVWRAVNVTIHLINMVLLFLIGGTLLNTLGWDNTTARSGSLAGTALWGLHPVHTQAVTYLVQRVASMMALFYLAAFYCLLRGWKSSSRKWIWFAASACLWLLALGTKENAASFPVIVLLVIFYLSEKSEANGARRVSRLNLVLGLSVLGLVGVVSAVFLTGKGLEGLYEAKGMSLWQVVITQPRVYWLYLTLVLFPLPGRLSIDRDFEPSVSILEPFSTLVAWCFMAGVLVWLYRGARLKSPAAFAVLWFFITIFIENSFLPLDLVYEHRLYLPTTVPFLILGGYLTGFYQTALDRPLA